MMQSKAHEHTRKAQAIHAAAYETQTIASLADQRGACGMREINRMIRNEGVVLHEHSAMQNPSARKTALRKSGVVVAY